MSVPSIDEIISMLDKVNEKIIQLQDTINSTMRFPLIPPWIRDKIHDLWDEFVAKMNTLWANVKEVFQNLGDPEKCYNTADGWTNQVGTPVSKKVFIAEAGSLTVDDNWTGTAAEKYKQNLLQQRLALEKIKANFTDGIAGALRDVAQGIYKFWAAVITGLVAFVVSLIGAKVASGTIVGIPVGIVLAIVAVGALAGAIAIGIALLRSDASSANNTLRTKLDFTGYNNGHWPSAVTN